MKKLIYAFLFLSSFFLFSFDVFAKVENNVSYNVPDESKLDTDTPFITNVDKEDVSYNTCELNMKYTSHFVDLSSMEISRSFDTSSADNSDLYWHSNFNLSRADNSDYGVFLTYFYFYFDDSRYCNNYMLVPNKHYEILVEIQKSDDLNFYMNSDTINLIKDNITFFGAKSTGGYDINNFNDYIVIKSINWVPPTLHNTDSDNYAYIKVAFEVSDLLDVPYLQLSGVSFESGDYSGNISQYMNSSSSFLFNTDTSSHAFKIRSFSLIEGYITLSGFQETDHNSGYSNGGGRWDNLDHISQDDIEIFNNELVCDDTDIVCHLKNGINYFKNMLTRFFNFVQGLGYAIYESLVNALKYLFIPDSEEFSSKISSISDSFTTQFGFIYDSFSLIGNFLNRFLHISDLQTNIIHIPVIKEPFNDVVLYNGTDFNIGEIFESGNFSNLYRIYRIFISAFLIISFLNYCKRVLMGIVTNTSSVLGG